MIPNFSYLATKKYIIQDQYIQCKREKNSKVGFKSFLIASLCMCLVKMVYYKKFSYCIIVMFVF